MRRGVGVAAVLVAVTVTVVANVGAAPASSMRVVDRTYSCKVRPARYIDLDSSVTLPPENGQPRAGQVRVTTVKKGIQRNGITFYVPQVFFEEKSDSLDVYRSACRRSSRRVPLEPTGLPSLPAASRRSWRLRARRRRPAIQAASTSAARRRSGCSFT